MSTPINDGGPAFPGIQGEEGHGNRSRIFTGNGENIWTVHNQGMSLRQFYAGLAMQGILASDAAMQIPVEIVTAMAFHQAASMLGDPTALPASAPTSPS